MEKVFDEVDKELILEYIKNRKETTHKEIADLFSLTWSRTYKLCRELEIENKIKGTVIGNGIQWKVLTN